MKRIAYIRSCGLYDDSRATKEIKALVEAGYYIHFIGWDRDGKSANKCQLLFPNHVSFSFYNSQVKGAIGFKGIFKLIGFFNYVKDTLKSLGNSLIAVHACDLDGGFGAYSFCKKTKIPLIYDIYDYYIDSHNIKGFLGKVVEKKEINLINLSHTTIICTEERRVQIDKATPSNIVVIHNSPDVEELHKSEVKYDYAYCGAFGSGRLLEELVNKYSENCDLKFVFAGGGRFEDIIKTVADKYDDFSFIGAISYDEVLRVESETAVLSAIYNPNKRNHILCAPNKFYEGLALGKPLIVCKGTGIDKIVEKEQLGITINYDPNEFFSALRRIIDNPTEMEKIGERGRKLYLEKYKWSIMKDRLINLYREL